MAQEHEMQHKHAKPAEETSTEGSEGTSSERTTFTGRGPVPPVTSGAGEHESLSPSERAFGAHDASTGVEEQRSYSVTQYEAMWEKAQGKKLTAADKKMIGDGGVGISANNIAGGGTSDPDPFPFPLDRAELLFATFEQAHQYMEYKNKQLHEWRADPRYAAIASPGEYVLFAKQYLSDPSDATDEIFRPDSEGRLQHINERYWERPEASDFEYGFWDEGSQSFWHANHMPEVTVFQSSKEYFTARHGSADRCIFGVALATHYDPGKEAIAAKLGGASGGAGAKAKKPRRP